ncbi:LysR family transcriptional regulator [Ralstonia insidiosa]|nr:LysR family transcriptional regulator [Ralstonia insidiosa]KMW46169.1 LysR family transcriptional regulator [Ralstonia sp. MD27]MBX3775401.1 LysR family transcriptional regulator [Ralstonia pickettii]NPA00830.1 LysR family transcriptional regulator [Betaproteobacteria bacterium]MBA9855242.1 LysR family transcriptional regulator [Ralstonia insidiosa]MBA9873132.1 LysR family transcriptional regulator [Ralstonia insidiosa]
MDNKAPRVTLRQWAVFAAIAQCETTTAAGSQLGLSQSAVSAALAELESTLGHPLFDRHARRLHLNALGRQLLPQAQALLDHADALEHATVQPNVRLKLAASSTIGNYVLPALLASFRQQIAPDSQLDVLIGNTQDVVDAVQRFEVDIGLIEGTCRGEALEIETWIDDEMVIVAAPDHPLARGPASRAALREAGWLMREPGSGTRELIDSRIASVIGPLHVALELGHSEAIQRTVAAGYGISCLSRHVVADALRDGRLVEVQSDLPRIARPLLIVRHRDKHPTHGLTQFIDALHGHASLHSDDSKKNRTKD